MTCLNKTLQNPTELTGLLEQTCKNIEDNPDWSNYRRYMVLLEITEAVEQLTDSTTAKTAAKAILEQSLSLAHGITVPAFRHKVLAAIAVAHGHFALWGDALTILGSVSDDDDKTDALTQILDLWVEHHKPEVGELVPG